MHDGAVAIVQYGVHLYRTLHVDLILQYTLYFKFKFEIKHCETAIE